MDQFASSSIVLSSHEVLSIQWFKQCPYSSGPSQDIAIHPGFWFEQWFFMKSIGVATPNSPKISQSSEDSQLAKLKHRFPALMISLPIWNTFNYVVRIKSIQSTCNSSINGRDLSPIYYLGKHQPCILEYPGSYHRSQIHH